jgi:DNA-binding MarR family transcriptional regulator/N-acetylglutamate synthase-like GNAT family acetyltransferase
MNPPMNPTTDPRVATLRAFNRFYTRRIGVLHEHLLASRFSLAETRVLWELAHRDSTSAAELARTLALDEGYLSRLLAGLKAQRLVTSQRAPHDGRQWLLKLSAAGRQAFAPLDRRSQAQTAALLQTLNDADQQRLVAAAAQIAQLLGEPLEPPAPLRLRRHRAGDIGWLVARHGALYAEEYGWDTRFEALVARIGAHFIEHLDAEREACWIAERDGRPLGGVMLVQARDEVTDAPRPGIAQLRMLLLEPAARGQGLGLRLAVQCERFARRAGYRRIVLWTNRNLDAARAIYVKRGYTLERSEAHESFGHRLVGEFWHKDLA